MDDPESHLGLPLASRRLAPAILSEGELVGDARWLGPQTVLEGRPPALMEAGTEGRKAASLFEARICEAAVFTVRSLLKTSPGDLRIARLHRTGGPMADALEVLTV